MMCIEAIDTTEDRGVTSRCRWLLAALVLLTQVGCHHLGPRTIMDDRVPYNQAVAESWKEQTLLNIVKLRYADTVMFSEISQIVSSYSMERSADVQFGMTPGSAPAIPTTDRLRALFNLRTRYSDRPTITYTPQVGSVFIRRLARPLPPNLVLFLLEAGYPANNILELTVDSINGVKNQSSSEFDTQPADPEFKWLVQVFRRAQLSRELSMRVELDDAKEQTTVLLLRSGEVEPGLEDELQMAKELLNLDVDSDEFTVVSGSVQSGPNEMAIQTRPILRVLSALAQYVQVPHKHLVDGSAFPVDLGDDVDDPPLFIHCSGQPPENCFAAVPYRGCWYWIDDCDARSKITFIYLFLLLAQAERDPGQTLPLVTIHAN